MIPLGFYALAKSAASSGLSISSRARQSTAPGGVLRPCSQSRKVDAGVQMRAAKSCCDSPSRLRARRMVICAGVWMRASGPMPALTSARAWRMSGKECPASASMADATCSMEKLRFILFFPCIFDFSGGHVFLFGFFVYGEQLDHSVFQQIEINNSGSTTFALSFHRPADFSCAASAGNNLSGKWVLNNKPDELCQFGVAPDFGNLPLKIWMFDHCKHGGYYTEFRYGLEGIEGIFPLCCSFVTSMIHALYRL